MGNNEKAQGLVEYGLILVLVGIVVIAVLMAIGPNIGRVFSTVNDSLSSIAGGGQVAVVASTTPNPPTNTPVPHTNTPVPPTSTPVPSWTFCATEWDYCNFSGTAPVRYGLPGYWVIQTHTNGVPCRNGVFGDPRPMWVKRCEVFQ